MCVSVYDMCPIFNLYILLNCSEKEALLSKKLKAYHLQGNIGVVNTLPNPCCYHPLGNIGVGNLLSTPKLPTGW